MSEASFMTHVSRRPFVRPSLYNSGIFGPHRIFKVEKKQCYIYAKKMRNVFFSIFFDFLLRVLQVK